MATNQPLPDREPLRDALSDVSAADSQTLAAALRRNRLTLLCGAPGAGKSALLARGLLPLLRRRGDDVAVSLSAVTSPTRQPSATVLPFPDRRSRGRAALAEMVILVSASSSAPAISEADLHDGIDAALRAAGVDPEWHRERLSERVASLTSRFGTRFLFVLDGFEAVLEAADDEAAEVVHQLVQLLNLPVPANLLIALRADAEILLAPVLARLPDVRAEVLLLEGGRTRRVYGPAAAPLPAPPHPHPHPHPHPSSPPPSPISHLDHAERPEAANSVASPWHTEVDTRRSTSRRRVALGSIALVALVAFIGGAVLLQTPPPAGPAAAPGASAEPLAAARPAVRAPPSLLPSPSPSPAPAATRPSIALRVDADNADGRLPRELALALTADGGADLRIVATPLAVPAASGASAAATDSPGFAIVRYDALQAASRGGAKPDLAVVAPLYTEEVQIVVRADSPLRFIHQIEGKRLDIGTVQSGRAVTARALYRQMFDRSLPATASTQRDAPSALQQLLAGGPIDAVVLVGPQPAEALAALPPAQRRGLRLLALAPNHPASRRALQTYLSATLRDAGTSGAGTTPSLAAMSFLVTTGTPDADTARALGELATSWCRSLPALQRDGDAKWRALPAGLQLETGWPRAGAAEAAWRACAATTATTASPAVTASPESPTRNRKERS